MFGRNASHKNPHNYKKLLSPFGQTVLDVLIKQAKSEQEQHNSNLHKRHYNYKERTERTERVLTFRNETTSSIVSPYSVGQPDEDPFDYEQDILNVPASCNTILATEELLNTPQINDNHYEDNKRNDNTSSREDLIRPADVITDTFNGNSSKGKENFVKSQSKCNEKDISWNNMFDSELFGDMTCDNNDKENGKNYNIKDINANESRTISINEPSTKTLQSKIKIISNEAVNLEDLTKNMKRKLQTHNTGPVIKKNKTYTKKSEPSFRKQKYNKAVKNWLNDVDPKNTIQEDVIQELDINITDANEQKHAVKVKCERKIAKNVKVDHEQPKKHNIEKGPKDDKVKKTVQCKLANRDGVMKFKKPKAIDMKSTPPECTSSNGQSDSIYGNTEHNDGKSNEKSDDYNGKSNYNGVKSDQKERNGNSGKNDFNNLNDDVNTPKKLSQGPEKKVKPKFVPPIKSQLPVKDIVYNMIELGKENSFEGDAFFAMEKQNISIILMFANGFNQLNIQYTEEETRASGLLLKTDNTHYFIRTRDAEQRTLMMYRERIRTLVTNNMVQCFDGKHVLMHLINKMELSIPPQLLDLFDLKIAGALLFPENIPETFSAVQKSLGESASYTVCTECPLQKGAWYLQQFETCVATARSMLQQLHMETVFYDIEMRLVPIVAGMECRGLRVEVNELSRAESALVRELAVAETACKELGGADFSPASLIHLRRVLYDKLQLHTHTNVPHTALTHQRSTNEETLRALSGVHELPGRVLRYRHVARARALLTALRQRIQHTNRLSPNWIQIASSTGRMAATNPNLQAIPKTPFIVTGEDGKESVNLRGIFVSVAGHTLVSLDFDHVECRLAARLAEDRPLLEALQHQDLFSHLAAHWLNKPASEVSAEERERAKRMVYASMYGAGTRKLMDILNLSYPQTRDLITTFNQRFPRLRQFCSEVRSQCEGGGGRVHTSTGRARNIQPELANTQAVNFIVQGTAADVCKRAMISAVAANTSASLLLQIHDELLWEVPNDQLHQTIAVIRECMEQSGFEDRLPVSVSTGPNWGEMTPYTTSSID